MILSEQEIKLHLALDPATGEDQATVDAMVGAFPLEIRPSIGTVFALAESAFSPPYIVLTIIAVGGWVTKRVFAPLLDEIGNRFRDAVFAYGRRGNRKPPGVGLDIARIENVKVSVSIPTESLLSWKDEECRFRELAEYILDGLPQVTVRRGQRVTLAWDPDRQAWVFCDMWPADVSSTFEYYIFNSRTRTWEKRSLGETRDKNSGEPDWLP